MIVSGPGGDLCEPVRAASLLQAARLRPQERLLYVGHGLGHNSDPIIKHHVVVQFTLLLYVVITGFLVFFIYINFVAFYKKKVL